MSNNDGGAAFPRPYGYLPDHPYGAGNQDEYGMTLRDWFAGQALAGICANTEWKPTDPDSIARDAYMHADAMLAARGVAS